MSIGPAEVGNRVVVRRRIPAQAGPTGGQAYSDVLGILEYWAADSIGVRRSDESLVDIPIADLFRAKRIPPPPTKRV